MKKGNCKKGLTLIEVIISLGIASMTVLTMLLFFGYSLSNIRVGKSIAQGTALAQRRMEDLKSDKARLVELIDDDFHEDIESEVVYVDAIEEPIQYKVEYKITRLPAPRSRVLDIVVRVSWFYQDFERDVTLESYYNLDY